MVSVGVVVQPLRLALASYCLGCAVALRYHGVVEGTDIRVQDLMSLLERLDPLEVGPLYALVWTMVKPEQLFAQRPEAPPLVSLPWW